MNPQDYSNQYPNQYPNSWQPMQPQQPAPEEKKGFAIASLVLGICSIVLMCCCCTNVITAPISIVLGIISLATHRGGKGMSIAGIILSALSILLLFICYQSTAVFWKNSDQILQDYTQLVEDADTVFPAYEKDGTVPDYLQKYYEGEYKDTLDKFGVTFDDIMDYLDQMYQQGEFDSLQSAMGSTGGGRNSSGAPKSSFTGVELAY